MKIIRFMTILVISAAVLFGCASLDRPRDTLFQVSTIDALLAGIYDGDATIGEVSRHGDFGIGTFAALDGEMVLLDGTFYQITSDGVAHTVSHDTQTPFCAVTFFEPDMSLFVSDPVDFPGLKEYVGERLPTENVFFAVKVKGTFDEIRVRSIPRQQKPYPVLTEVVKDQPVFTFRNVAGTLVGFVCPEYVAGVNVVGWHLHFIADDRRVGGHVLAFEARDLSVEIDETPSFSLYLPTDASFYGTDLSGDTTDAVGRVEK
ncbi:MAG: acetolactate decarboxylase [Deltaproteobacteria bacterium]|nr:acetolactate decarboxylase [Candidatus Zymogenaceae bacterium]